MYIMRDWWSVWYTRSSRDQEGTDPKGSSRANVKENRTKSEAREREREKEAEKRGKQKEEKNRVMRFTIYCSVKRKAGGSFSVA